jgi:long-chain acyl-CoA synthetase
MSSSKSNSNLLDHSNAVSLWQVWQKTAQMCPNTLMLHDPHVTPEVKLTYQEAIDQMASFGAGLRSLGLKFGDKVALIADNSPRWFIADQGILAIGAANATRSSQAERTELLYIIEHSDSVALVVEDLATLKKLQPELQSLPIKTIVLLSDQTPPEGVYNFKQIIERGSDSHGDAYRRDLGNPAINRDTLATLIYTSGTTGKPKGVMLSHGNLLTQVWGGKDMVQPFPGEIALAILPTWHSYERAGEYYLLSQGMTQIYTNLRHVKTDLAKYKPHYMVAVPRLWESVYEGITKKFAAESSLKRKLINFLLSASRTYIKARRIVQNMSLVKGSQVQASLTAIALAPVYWLADKIVFKKIRDGIGGRIKYFTSGGGSLQPHIDLFYEVAGLEIINGYGLTETSPMLTARRPERNLRGTAGKPLQNTEIRIVDPDSRQIMPSGSIGLVLARGPQIMQGYYKNPEATAKAIDPDGWFDTGDLGWLTTHNDLVLTGRAKDTIVLTNGENIEPQSIEDACSRSPYIDQIVLVGQDQKQLGALIVPNLAPLEMANLIPQDAQLKDVIEDLKSEKIMALYREELNREVKSRPGYSANDRIGPFAFLPEPIAIDNGLMTQTFKIRRNVVTDRYRDIIDKMFI